MVSPHPRLSLLAFLGATVGLAWLVCGSGCTSSSAGPSDGGANEGVPSADGASMDDQASAGDGAPDDANDGNAGDAAIKDDFAWVTSFAAASGSNVLAMAADASSVVIVGQLGGPATFGGTTLDVDGGGNNGSAFIAKLDAQGNLQWAKAATGATSLFESVLIDPAGNILVAGDGYGDAPTFEFDGVSLPTATSGVLFELDPNGAVVWTATATATGAIDFGSIAFSGTNVVVAGALNGDGTFAGDAGLPVPGCTGTGCVFMAMYSSGGAPMWAEKAPSTPQRGNAAGNPREVWVAASASSIWLGISGYFESGMGASDANQLVVNAYDPAGALTWSKSFPDLQGSPTLSGLAADTSGNLFIGGSFAQGLELGSGSFASGTYVAKLTSSGSVAWAESDPPSGQLGIYALALGDQLYTFGNGNLGSPPEGMSLDGLDPADGRAVSADGCQASGNLGQEVAVSSAGVFVAGQGGPPAVFGQLDGGGVTQKGLFVAKRKPPGNGGG